MSYTESIDVTAHSHTRVIILQIRKVKCDEDHIPSKTLTLNEKTNKEENNSESWGGKKKGAATTKKNSTIWTNGVFTKTAKTQLKKLSKSSHLVENGRFFFPQSKIIYQNFPQPPLQGK